MIYQMGMDKAMNALQRCIKRIFDILFSAAAMILLSPVFFALAAWIILDDGLPVFFRQQRSGKDDCSFYIFKFRSMKNNQAATAKKEDPYAQWNNGVPDDFVFKTAGEANPNVTRSGYFIRKYSLDELPQFMNVLKGEMSIIGPRPEIVPISDKYNKHQRQRLRVKPGITGWAQVNGRSDMNHGEKIRHDLYYVEHASLSLDIKIFLRTVTQVLIGKGSV